MTIEIEPLIVGLPSIWIQDDSPPTQVTPLSHGLSVICDSWVRSSSFFQYILLIISF